MHAQLDSPKHTSLAPNPFRFNTLWLWTCLAATCLLTLPVGCATHSKRIASLRNSFHTGDLDSANKEVDKLLGKNKRDGLLIKLDQSLVSLADANPAKSESILREVRNQFAANDPLADLGNLASLMVDDQSRPFQPDDYEKLFVLMYLAIANLVQNGDDAHAYANQVMNLQSEIEQGLQQEAKRFELASENNRHSGQEGTYSQVSHNLNKPKNENSPVSFQKIALAPFISGILHEQTHRDYDSAARFYSKAIEFNPELEEAHLGLERSRNGHHSRKGNGAVYVFVALGKGPYKVEKAEVPTSQAMLIADRILSAIGDHTLPPTIAPIKTSHVIIPINDVKQVNVSIDGQLAGSTKTVTDLGQIALEQYKAKYHAEMARAIVRRIVKKGAVYASKDALGTDNHSWVDLLINVGGVIWEATESADTRCWGLLPEKIQVLRVELPVGRHQIGLTAPTGKLKSETYSADAEVRDGANTYIYACFPTQNLAGKILVSNTE